MFQCYETASDLLYAHGYNRNESHLSLTDVQSLLPAILYSIENPGCSRQSPPSKSNSFFDGIKESNASIFENLVFFYCV